MLHGGVGTKENAASWFFSSLCNAQELSLEFNLLEWPLTLSKMVLLLGTCLVMVKDPVQTLGCWSFPL